MMHFRGLVLFLFCLRGCARRRTRIDESHQDVQQQNSRTATGFEVSAEAQEALIPGGLRTGIFRRAGPQTEDLKDKPKQYGWSDEHPELDHVVPWFRFGWRRANVNPLVSSSDMKDQLQQTKDLMRLPPALMSGAGKGFGGSEISGFGRLASFSADSKPAGFACIPVPVSRILAPGQKAIMHVYDASSLQVLRHAQAYANGTYGQVVFDEDAMLERKFGLLGMGSRVKILSMTPSTHKDKFGGTSASMMCEVMGIGLIQPKEVLQKMPFMMIGCSDDDALLQPPETEFPSSELSMRAAKLEEAANLCQDLDELASFKGPLTQAAERGKEPAWSLSACTDQVISIRGRTTVCGSSRLLVSALAASVHLPGPVRYELMLMAHKGDAVKTVQLVTTALEEEARRRLAMKALADLKSEG